MRITHLSSPTTSRSCVDLHRTVLLLTCVLFSLSSGCASTQEMYNSPHLSLATSRLPAVRVLPYPPDSLVHATLDIKHGDTTLTMPPQWSLVEARRMWSASGVWEGGRIPSATFSPPRKLNDFATLHSLELTLAEAAAHPDSAYAGDPEYTATTLSQRLQTFREYVRIHYCNFYEFSSRLENPPRKHLANRKYDVLLENDRGERRVAEHIELRLQGSTSAPENNQLTFYKCYDVYFRRTADGEDILDRFTSLTFWPQYSPRRDLFFTWMLPHDEVASNQQLD